MLLLLKPYLICFNLSHTFDSIFPIAKKKNEERMSTFYKSKPVVISLTFLIAHYAQFPL